MGAARLQRRLGFGPNAAAVWHARCGVRAVVALLLAGFPCAADGLAAAPAAQAAAAEPTDHFSWLFRPHKERQGRPVRMLARMPPQALQEVKAAARQELQGRPLSVLARTRMQALQEQSHGGQDAILSTGNALRDFGSPFVDTTAGLMMNATPAEVADVVNATGAAARVAAEDIAGMVNITAAVANAAATDIQAMMNTTAAVASAASKNAAAAATGSAAGEAGAAGVGSKKDLEDRAREEIMGSDANGSVASSTGNLTASSGNLTASFGNVTWNETAVAGAAKTAADWLKDQEDVRQRVKEQIVGGGAAAGAMASSTSGNATRNETTVAGAANETSAAVVGGAYGGQKEKELREQAKGQILGEDAPSNASAAAEGNATATPAAEPQHLKSVVSQRASEKGLAGVNMTPSAEGGAAGAATANGTGSTGATKSAGSGNSATAIDETQTLEPSSSKALRSRQIKDLPPAEHEEAETRSQQSLAPSSSRQAAAPPPGVLVAPEPNDTITAEYWNMVNDRIFEAGLLTTTAPPAHHEDGSAAAAGGAGSHHPPRDPFQTIYQASESVYVGDTPGSGAQMNDWQSQTPAPLFGGAPDSNGTRQVGVVPYDMALGAMILHSLSRATSGQAAPDPAEPSSTSSATPSGRSSAHFLTQAQINEAVHSKCPMLVFNNSQMSIRAPHCNEHDGVWADPGSDEVLLRWNSNKIGGLSFALDTATEGNGSHSLGGVDEMFSWSKYLFPYKDCRGFERFRIEEKIFKMTKMSPGARSTLYDHDVANTQLAYFYQYILWTTAGRKVASSGLARVEQNEVNFTWFGNKDIEGTVIGVAKRQGHWTGDGWRKCTTTTRGWLLTFPVAAGFTEGPEAQDIRIALGAMLTLMAYRDEYVSIDGFIHLTQPHLYFTIFRLLGWSLVGLVALMLLITVVRKKQFNCGMCCLKFEAFVFPSMTVRTPMIKIEKHKQTFVAQHTY